MKKSVAMKWVNALRSGKYKQGRMYLHNKAANTFCCLGVLDDLYPKLNLSSGVSGVLINYKLVGLDGPHGTIGDSKLTVLNDLGVDGSRDPFTFDEIADVIQAEYVERVME